MPLSRRHFLAGTAAVAGLSLWPIRRLLAAQLPDIIDVSGSDPEKMVNAALEAIGGIKRIVKRGDFVVLKPNAGFANPPDWGTTTHPQTVVAVAKACLNAGAKRVTIVEYPQGNVSKCLKRCGLQAALTAVPEVQVKLLGAAEDFKSVNIAKGKACKKVEVAKLVLSADVLINIPAAKAHTETTVSLGLKNAMGLIKDRAAFHTQFDLHQAIADLGHVIKPQLTIVDATRALLTNGPAGPGETVTPGRLAVGRNVTSVDAYALSLARFAQRQLSANDVKHIAFAGAAGLGEVNIAKLKVKKVQA
ncbi:MAG: DUF362 domain-containing protein [Deltaproteobacteria bacterium]|nr:DUF362 domain-containing protein [Deltaproteobacteria bacterium]